MVYEPTTNFEALYAAHPGVPRTVVRKIYEWKVTRDPDICPLYGNVINFDNTTGLSGATGGPSADNPKNFGGNVVSTSHSGTGRFILEAAGPSASRMMTPFPRYLAAALRRGEPIILTRNPHYYQQQKSKNRPK